MSALDLFSQQAPGLSDARRRAQLKVLRHFEQHIAPATLLSADEAMLRSFLQWRRAEGAEPNTVRKERAMIGSFYTWAWREGLVRADALLAVQGGAGAAGLDGGRAAEAVQALGDPGALADA